MAITAQMVKELRERTSAGMLDCKKALQENEGNFDKVENKAQQKDNHHHQQHGAEHATGHVVEEFMNHFFAIEAAEHQGEQGSADEDGEHHAGDLGGGEGDFLQVLPG